MSKPSEAMSLPIRRAASVVAVLVLVLAQAPVIVAAPRPVAPDLSSGLAATGAGGGLAVTTVDPAGTSLVGTCFELWTDAGSGTRGTLVADSARCDQPRGATGEIGPQDGSADGSTGWTSLAAGSYLVHETLGPALAGTAATYELAPDASVTVAPGAVASLRLVHRPTAGLTLHKVDAAGKPLVGACFSLTYSNNRTIRTVALCDGPAPAPGGLTADGLADGLLIFTALAPTGTKTTYALKEIHAPDGYAVSTDQSVDAFPEEPTELTITNATGAAGQAGLAVSTVDPAGTVLVGSCFALWTDAGGGARGTLVAGTQRCDSPAGANATRGQPDGHVDGSVGWTALAPADYVLVETLPPALAGIAATYESAPDTAVRLRADGVTRQTLVHRPTAGLTLRKVDEAGRPAAEATA